MTITADVNALTGTSFNPTEVTAAITAAFNIISGEVETTIVEDDNESLDSAALILARKILERGRISAKQRIQDAPADYVDNIITKEVRALINLYTTETNQPFFSNQSPQTFDTSQNWR